MSIKLGNNIASLLAQRRLGEATSSLSTIQERLSSGLRINRASDDAAGLAIADELNMMTRVYTQAIRNGNDGVSLLSIADSAVSVLTDITTRIRELAEQAANGSYSDTQRQALDKEAQALRSEFTRIARSTEFNGINLFDGTLGSGVRLQLGIGEESSLLIGVGGAIGTGSFENSTTYTTETWSSSDAILEDLNADGILDLVTAGRTTLVGGDGYATVRLGLGGGSFGAATSYTMDSNRSNSVSLGDLNGDNILDLVTVGYEDGLVNGRITVRLGSGDGSFGIATSFITAKSPKEMAIGDFNGDNILDLVTVGLSAMSQGIVSVHLGDGSGNFSAAVNKALPPAFPIHYDLTIGDITGDGVLDIIAVGKYNVGYADDDGFAYTLIGNGDGSFQAPTSLLVSDASIYNVGLEDLNGDGVLDLITSGSDQYYNTNITVRLGSGSGTFSNAISYSGGGLFDIGDINGDGNLDIVSSVMPLLGNGDGTFVAGQTTSLGGGILLADLNDDGVLDKVSAGRFSGTGGAVVSFGETQDGISALLDFSLSSRAEALDAIEILSKSLDRLTAQRGVIGSHLSRLSFALNFLTSSRQNFSEAESRIRDADVAAESANYVRTQILQQAANAILAQANQTPALALKLLDLK